MGSTGLDGVYAPFNKGHPFFRKVTYDGGCTKSHALHGFVTIMLTVHRCAASSPLENGSGGGGVTPGIPLVVLCSLLSGGTPTPLPLR